MSDSDYKEGIAYRYLQETKHSLGTPLSDHLGPLKRPSSLKTYPHAAKISLPDPDFSTANIWECLAKRRSLRDYKPEPLSLKELSSLLWATQGKTLTSAHSFYRAAPSAGALYPIETYIVINHVKEIENSNRLTEAHKGWVEEVLEGGGHIRDAKWSDSIAARPVKCCT